MKKISVAIVVLILAGAASFIGLKDNKKEPQFRTEKVTRGDIEASVSATGTVNAVTTVLVGTQVSGTVKEIHADFNSPVKKGQLIARIDPASFEAQADQAMANLLLAKANLEKTEASLVDAQRTMNRNKELYSKNLIARSEFDTSETNHDSAKAQVAASKAQVKQAEAALRNAETSLRYTRILSPVDGVIISRNVDIGQTVAASFQTPTLFTIAQDLTKMQIDTNVSEADIGVVKINQSVQFTVDAYPESVFKGSVSQIRNAPIVVQNVVTYDVVIKVDNSELKLKPGMTANVSIVTSSKKDILKLPNAALRFSPNKKAKNAEHKGAGVWIIEKEEPKRIKISTGISDENYTELLSGEVKEGQELIVESLIKTKEKRTGGGPRFF
ncbi:MAG: efflux RND transporter periplasmic adaptor subunit [Nitrospirae bacterium]|nr:efflux RND transporter periplasmic adaptor subunit [Nitrospirota bacterium]